MKDLYKEVGELNDLKKVPLSHRLAKLFEESGELAQEVNRKIGMKKNTKSDAEIKQGITEEAADVIQNVFSVIQDCDIEFEDLVKEMRNKNIKWKNTL